MNQATLKRWGALARGSDKRYKLVRREIYIRLTYIRSLIRSRLTRKPAIYVIGDSHVGLFLRQRPFVVHWLGPVTAHNLKQEQSTLKANARLMRIIDKIVREGDTIIMVFGEIDCRIHIYHQYLEHCSEVPMRDFIAATVANYAVVLDQLAARGIEFYVYSVMPAAREGNIYGVPNYPPPEARCAINRGFNESLRSMCEDHGYRFIDVYSRIVDREGFIRDEFTQDGVHASPEVIRFVRDELERVDAGNG